MSLKLKMSIAMYLSVTEYRQANKKSLAMDFSPSLVIFLLMYTHEL